MRFRNIACSILMLAAFAVCLTTTVNASTILIDPTTNNGSFESPVIAGTGIRVLMPATPTGWNNQVTGMLADLVAAHPDNHTYTGTQFVFMDAGQGLVRNLADTFQANTTYTLTMDATWDVAAGDKQGQLSLLGHTSGGTVQYFTMTTANQYFAPVPALVIDTAVQTELVGQAIDVKVYSLAEPDKSVPGQLWVDNVVLTSTPSVPEPGTLALLACGLIGLVAYAWRKR